MSFPREFFVCLFVCYICTIWNGKNRLNGQDELSVKKIESSPPPPNSICYLLNWRIMIKSCVFSGKIGYKLEEETIWECKNKSKYSHTHKNESKSVAKQLAVACIGSLPLDFHESGEISHPRVKPLHLSSAHIHVI